MTIDIAINYVFTYHKAMKESDAELFILQCRSRFMIMILATTGLLLNARIFHPPQKKFKLFGVSSASVLRVVY